MNPLLLLSLLGGGLFLFMKKTQTTPYIPPQVTPSIQFKTNPAGGGTYTVSQGYDNVLDGSNWQITGGNASTGYTTLLDPNGNVYQIPPGSNGVSVAPNGGTDYHLNDGRIVRNPPKSPNYKVTGGVVIDSLPQTTPWSESHSPDQSPPSVATPVPTLQQVITSSLPQAINTLQQAGMLTQAQPYTVLSQGPSVQKPTSNNQIPTLPNLPAGLPNIANLSSPQLRVVATQLSSLGQTVLAKQLNDYADMMDSTGQKTVYVTPNPNAPIVSNW